MNHLIDVVGRHAGLQRAGRNIQDFTGQTAHTAHAILLLLVQDLDAALAEEALLGDRDTIFGVVRVGDGARDGALRRQRVDGTQTTGELEGGERVEIAGCWIRFRNYLRRK